MLKEHACIKISSIAFALAAITGCQTNPGNRIVSEGSIPKDIAQGNYQRYKTLDDIISGFRDAGAQVREYAEGNIVHIPVRPGGQAYLNVDTVLERTCLAMRGKQGEPKRGDNLRTGWYYLFEGGPTNPFVNFNEEVSSAQKIVFADVLSRNTREVFYWDGPHSHRSSTRAGYDFTGKSDDYFCGVYEKGVVQGFEKEKILNPLFVAFKRCDFKGFDKDERPSMCHWVLLKPPYLIDRVKYTRMNAEMVLAQQNEQRQAKDKAEQAKRQQKAEEEALQRKRELDRRLALLPAVKTVGAKICRTHPGFAQEYSGYLFAGKPQYDKYNGDVSITGFTEGVSGERIQIRVGGIGFYSPNFGKPKSLRLDETDYNGTTLRNGSVFWDNAIDWTPC